jgi:hypothetical protein
MIKVFDTESQFEAYTANGMQSGDLYFVNENESVHFRTNNIDGSDTSYNIGNSGGTTPSGNITITENGDNIDVAQYATATVNVQPPQPTYTEATIVPNEYNVEVPCVAGDTFEVYNPNHKKIWVYCVDSNGENTSGGICGNYEKIYLTVGDQVPWYTTINPTLFNIAPDMSASDDITIYYRKL